MPISTSSDVSLFSLSPVARIPAVKSEPTHPLIPGSEFRLDHALHLVLLATNRTSYGGLSALISLARRRAPKGEYRLQRDELLPYTDDCLLIWVNAEQCDTSRDTATWIHNHFTKRAWIGVTRQLDGRDRQRLQTLQTLGQQFNLPLVACGGVTMHTRSRRQLRDILTAIRMGARVRDAGFALHANGGHCLCSRTSLSRLYPQALLDESQHIAGLCSFSLDELRYEYPRELVPDNTSPSAWLRQLTEAGMHRRWPQGDRKSVV